MPSLITTGISLLFALVLSFHSHPVEAAGPAIGSSWHLQLDGRLKMPDRQLYDIDLYDTPAATIASLRAAGRIVICYFSAGTFEDWRPDGAGFPEAALGKPLADWPGERWLDIRHPTVRQIMLDRLGLAQQKGCDGVDPDNVDGYSNDTGLPLGAADQLDYNRFLADAAHARGLLIGLKNAVALAPDLVAQFDFAINESCYRYRECGVYQNFIAQGKAVFIAEYRQPSSVWCQDAARNRFSLQFFRRGLNSVGTPCPG
ncbi:endo alpha-1,4 polygalactosaminidase [Chitinimonas lacunae]|uniref:Endo alpha-1,4 polygalactosaminidase n=1 Tax=Chitinimonas lacunae TaxID=1963018 RepID=A0ABV8MLG1_9NEIS